MFRLKHVTPTQLTAENNFGLQAREWLTQSLPPPFCSLWGLGLGLMGVGWAGGSKDKRMNILSCDYRQELKYSMTEFVVY